MGAELQNELKLWRSEEEGTVYYIIITSAKIGDL